MLTLEYTMNPTPKILGLLAAWMLGSPLSYTATFEADFATATFNNQNPSYLGGWFGSEIAFGEWYGSDTDVEIGPDGLQVANTTTTSAFRGAAIFLDPSVFTSGAGTHTLEFEVTNLSFFSDSSDPDSPWTGTPGENGVGWVEVVEATGYNLDPNYGDAVIVTTTPISSQVFEAQGNANVESLASQVIESAGFYSLSFDYGGSGAVGLAFGSIDSNWPHTLINYDDVVVIPEVSSVMLMLLAFGATFLGVVPKIARRIPGK